MIRCGMYLYGFFRAEVHVPCRFPIDQHTVSTNSDHVPLAEAPRSLSYETMSIRRGRQLLLRH